jgi:hypothetical protein
MQLHDYYSKRLMLTQDMQDPAIIHLLKTLGFIWIRRYIQPLDSFLRTPTLGCWVELFKVQDMRCIPIDSPQGKKLIKRLCYF